MATSTPVAFRTRSRLRKRKGNLLQGLSPSRKTTKSRTSKAEEPTLSGRQQQEQLAEDLKENAVRNVSSCSTGLKKKRSKKAGMETDVSKHTKQILGQSSTGNSMGQVTEQRDEVATGSEARMDGDVGEQENPEQENSIVVLQHDELTPVDDIEAELGRVLDLVKSEEWTDQYEATTLIRRFVHSHSHDTEAFMYAHAQSLIAFLKTNVDSLRSAQSRNALFAIGELFELIPDKLRFVSSAGEELDLLVEVVLTKSANDKRFIASAGEAALDKMVASASSLNLLLPLLRHSGSKNNRVCAVVSRYSARCLKEMINNNGKTTNGTEVFEDLGVAKQALQSFAELELGRSVEAKKPAQASLRMLHRTLRAELFETIAKECLNQADASHVLALVRTTKSSGAKKPSLRELMAEKRREMSRKNSAMSNKDASFSSMSSTDVLVQPKPPSKFT